MINQPMIDALENFTKPVVFCDASVKENGDAVAAVWTPFDMSFTVSSVGNYGKKSRKAVTSAEIAAISLAGESYPGFTIYSDSQDAIRLSKISAIWVPRERNTFADKLTKQHPGSGFICFNNPSPSRNWMEFTYL